MLLLNVNMYSFRKDRNAYQRNSIYLYPVQSTLSNNECNEVISQTHSKANVIHAKRTKFMNFVIVSVFKGCCQR